MHAAAWSDHSGDVVKLLLDRGANVEARNDRGETPLLKAARSNHIEMVKLLLKTGAEIDAKAGSATPLHTAISRGHQDMVELLRKHGAKE